MAGSFRIEGYLPFYNNSMTRTGSNGGRSVSSYASGLFASSNAKSLGDDSFNKVADGINDDASDISPLWEADKNLFEFLTNLSKKSE